ncbi:MAG: amidohydrolase family protein [Burkholderiales bacterium]|jgi:cytosine/adenosine deaminase-related metal-dependent hydrolase|nr:amidohydrolase family protein [Burkholderiales bacterium]
MTRTLIRGGTVLSLDPAVGDLPQGDVLVEGTVVRDVAPSIDAHADRVIDARGAIVMPGLINAHIHTWETALRGLGNDWAGSDYFNFFHAKLAPLFTPQDTYIATLMGALAQMDAGVTGVLDWCHNNATPAHTDAAIEALFDSGIRAVFGHGTVKAHAKPGEKHFSEVPHPLDEIRRLRAGRLSSDDALVTLAMAILGPDYSTLEVSRQDFRAAREFGLLSTAHVWGRPNRLVPGGYRTIAAEGLLGPDHNLVHANYFEDDELKIVVDSGASVTSTTAGEMNNHVRISLSRRVRDLGGQPSIGTDSEVATKGDMFDAMRSALRMQRLYANIDTVRTAESAQDSAAADFVRKNLKTVGTGGSPIQQVAVKTREVLEWATVNNARALRWDRRVGRLAPGLQADLIVVRRDGLHIASAQDPVQAVVSYAQSSDVDTVMVAGRVVKEAGRLNFPMLGSRVAELRASGERLLAAAQGAPAAHA